MWGSICIPRKVYQVLYPLKKHFCYVQAQHLLVCCWLLMALIRDPGTGTLKGFKPYLPPTLKYWTTVRMIRSSQWDAAAVVCDLATATLRTLPPPSDGILSLIGDSTVKDKRGRKHPLGRTTRHSEHEPYTFGFEMVLLIASWGRLRVPVALAPIDSTCRGHQNILFRQMRRDFVPPAWVQQVVVLADAGFAAKATLHLITAKHYTLFLRCHAPGNLRTAHISVTWCNTSRRAVTIAAPAINLTGAAATTGSLPAAPRCIIWAMSRSSPGSRDCGIIC